MAIFGIWKYQAQSRERLTGVPKIETQTAMPPSLAVALPKETPPPAVAPDKPAPDKSTPDKAAANPAPTPASPPQAAPDTSARKALTDQAQRAATEARTLFDRADEASKGARSMLGEARIVAARAARPDLENAERLSYDGGASYIGQVVDGKRQGLGVAELGNGERQAGDWDADRLNGLGTVRLSDDTRYAGQWRDGQSTGLGVRERPGIERSEGNFVAGRLEGPGVRRTLTDPNVVQSGEFQSDQLDGPGVEAIGDRERYAGGFRNGRRQGYGQVTSADGTVRAGLWEDGKLVDSTP